MGSKGKLKIFFVPIDGMGHMNAAIGIAQVLLAAGHRTLFAINIQWRGKLTKFGIEEVLIPVVDRDQQNGDVAKLWADRFASAGMFESITPLEKSVNLNTISIPEGIERMKKMDPIIDKLLQSITPDVILLDQAIMMPAVVKSGIPWVLVSSFNPLFHIPDERAPPACSGLPAVGPNDDWKRFRITLKEATHEVWLKWNEFIVSQGLEPLNTTLFINDSKYLNIYGFPKELDYTDIRPVPPNWIGFDNLKRTENHLNFEIPEQLSGKPGKLIYFSMGLMGGTVIPLMKRLVAILAKSKHRFIVSKGPLHTQYSLADNMFGEQTVPQIQVLPKVDLVITHGGNNTVTETFYFGKPVIVMPLFGDQYDNAQRVEEKGFGIRLDAHRCTEEELLNAIERLLNDKELNERLKNISERIQTENTIGKLPQLIEDLVIH